MSKHTPGPWSVKEGNYTFSVLDSRGVHVIDTWRASDADRQNARLIAAAPDLLARLETHADAACLGWNRRFYVEGCGCGPCLDRAALAKARGEG